MNRVKFEFQEILAFITIMILIFGANGLNFLKLNKMVTQEEFRDLKCQFIKLQKISAEKEKEQLKLVDASIVLIIKNGLSYAPPTVNWKRV